MSKILRISKRYKIDLLTAYVALKRNKWDMPRTRGYIEHVLIRHVFKIF